MADMLIEDCVRNLKGTLVKQIISCKTSNGEGKYVKLSDLEGKTPSELAKDGISKYNADPLSDLDKLLQEEGFEGVKWRRNYGSFDDRIHNNSSAAQLEVLAEKRRMDILKRRREGK